MPKTIVTVFRYIFGIVMLIAFLLIGLAIIAYVIGVLLGDIDSNNSLAVNFGLAAFFFTSVVYFNLNIFVYCLKRESTTLYNEIAEGRPYFTDIVNRYEDVFLHRRIKAFLNNTSDNYSKFIRNYAKLTYILNALWLFSIMICAIPYGLYKLYAAL